MCALDLTRKSLKEASSPKSHVRTDWLKNWVEERKAPPWNIAPCFRWIDPDADLMLQESEDRPFIGGCYFCITFTPQLPFKSSRDINGGEYSFALISCDLSAEEVDSVQIDDRTRLPSYLRD